ncbi:MAG: hypothetical protein HZC22_08420 [Rhodocyclales bacterium]|nr:hypothetical protein [Rhodocyclales bacterium]
MKLKPVDQVSSEPVQASFGFGGQNVMPIRPPSSDSRAEQLMPYEKAAKAIYVRANGLPAYRRVTGHIHRFSDGGESETK